jgi:type II secretory pathway component GspD/PulD (secretin)
MLKPRFFLPVCLLATFTASLLAAQDSGNERYRVFLLKNITPKDAMQFLADVNIAKVSQLSDANMLLITADQESLVKASNVIKLIDSQEKYVMKVLMPAADANKMPAIGAMEAEISESMPKISTQNSMAKNKSVSIGTFLSLPSNAAYKVALDTHNGSLIAVAPVNVMSKITAIAERVTLLSTKPPSAVNKIEPEQENNSQNEPNVLFNSLLSSLDKAEKDLTKIPKKTPAPDSQVYGENMGVKDSATAKTATATSAKPDVTKKKPAGKGRAVPPEPNKADANSPAAQTANQETKDDSNAVNLYEPNYVPNADETLELTLPDKLDIITLLDLVGKYLNLNYVYDDKIKNIQVNLRIQGPIKVRELYPLVESVMKFTNLVMTRKGNLVTIVTPDQMMDVDPMLMDGTGNRVKAGDIVVTRVFQLNYIDTSNAKSLLEQMKLGAVTELQNMGTIIVTGYAYRMNRIEQLLEVVDKPGKPKQFKFRQLHYTMAKMLAPKIKGLIDQLGDISAVVATSAAPTQPTPGRRGDRPIARQPNVPPQPAAGAPASKTSIYLDADERTNRILMIGNDDELAIVNNLIDSLDVAQQDLRTLRVYEIQHVDAEEVRKKLEALGIVGASRESTPTTPGGRITYRAPQGDQGQQGSPPTQSPTPSQQSAGGGTELPTEELQVVVIESTNSLMVNATPEQHLLIASIIAYVDSESIQQSIPYVVYPLQNQPPEHVAEVLDKLVKEVIRDNQGKIEKIINKTDQEVIIVPDPSTFSLIVYASKKNQDWIANLVKTLDRRRPQVLIDVTLVEVTNVNQFELDLQLAGKLPEMVPGVGFLPVIDSNSMGKQRKEAYVAGGRGSAFYSDKHMQALLTAMESKSYGRILAKPKILVNDGQKGSIRTTDTTNIKVETTIVPNQGNSTTNTTYQQYNAGITLEIQPNIGEGDLLLLIVRLDRTDFVPGGATDAPPNTKANTVDTIVTVPNSKTIILGGMLKLNQSKAADKVPILGDIPIIGGLFRSTSNSVADSKLYVFVKANILRPEDGVPGLPELERISERNRSAFESSEDKFQKHQDWPGVKPSTVDPVRVLDAE